MAFKALAVSVRNESNLPFLEEWVEKQDKKVLKKLQGSSHIIKKMSFGRKGLILTSESFAVFLWKGSEAYLHLKEASVVWANGGPTSALAVVLDDIYSADWNLGLDDEVQVDWSSEKLGKILTIGGSGATPDPSASNPFLGNLTGEWLT